MFQLPATFIKFLDLGLQQLTKFARQRLTLPSLEHLHPTIPTPGVKLPPRPQVSFTSSLEALSRNVNDKDLLLLKENIISTTKLFEALLCNRLDSKNQDSYNVSRRTIIENSESFQTAINGLFGLVENASDRGLKNKDVFGNFGSFTSLLDRSYSQLAKNFGNVTNLGHQTKVDDVLGSLFDQIGKMRTQFRSDVYDRLGEEVERGRLISDLGLSSLLESYK